MAGEKQSIKRSAAMVVIANATKYGTGAVINPDGKLDDGLFEIIVIRKISFQEILKMMITHREFDRSKTELFTAASVEVHSKHRVHFQVDGEYLGKIHPIQADILSGALRLLYRQRPKRPERSRSGIALALSTCPPKPWTLAQELQRRSTKAGSRKVETLL